MRENKGILRSIKAHLNHNRLGDILVLKGAISADQLRTLLSRQKEQSVKFGQLLIQENIISRRQLATALATQSVMRSVAASIAVFAALATFSTKQSNAGTIKDIPAGISLVSASKDFKSVNYYPALFGSSERASSDISAFTKWRDMFNKFERDILYGNGEAEMVEWKNNIEKYKGMPLKTMAAKVNTLINKTEYITDDKNWGKSDYWATPVEFFKRGGDCEDFAIAKYVSLRALGVPESRMRIAIVQDTLKNIPHAILVVYTNSGAVVLDNQSKTMKYANTITRYKPIFSINRTAWWLHKAPASTTLVASAQ
ncbi:MAG: transglutaminase-like cysteine peptidase [Bdellovibrionales bacterium]